MSKLVIVESPSKSKTLQKYLGADYDILASYGHVRDLQPKTGAVDTENFSMKYQIIERNAKHVEAIVKAAKKADEVLLATDPDREGEAISWHISEILKERKVKTPMKRVAFYEITESAVQDAVRNPREIATDLVDAQQARRALDYLVGFNLSPLAVAQDQPRPERGSRAIARAADDRRARGRNRSLRAARILVAASRHPQGCAAVHRQAHPFQGREARAVHGRTRSAQQGMAGHAGRQGRARHAHRKEASRPSSRCAVHHLDPAAGRRAPARHDHRPGHAHRTAIVRRHGPGRRPGRPHHLHAYRLGESGAGSHHRHPQVCGRQLRQGFSAAHRAAIQGQNQECAGSARSRAPDLGHAYARSR